MIFIIKADLTEGAYMPKEEVSRSIRIGGTATLDDLLRLIIDSIGFDHDHLYAFSFGKSPYSSDRSKVYFAMPDPGELSTKTKLYKLHLRKGSRFWLVYDFGDSWTFYMTVEEALNESGNIRPSVIESVGTVEQYPDEEEWESMEDDEDMENADSEEEINGKDAFDQQLGEIGTDDMDLSSEYFDADYYNEDSDTNPVLGRILIRVVERQIELKEPAFVERAYEQLQEKGYIRKAAKIRLANALSNEVFEIMKYNKPNDESRYEGFVQEIVAEPFDPDIIPDIETGKEHLISEGLGEFSELLMDNKAVPAADRFSQLWPEIREWIDNNYTRMEGGKLLRFSLEAIDEALDFRMNLYNALMDSGMAYLNSKKYEEGVKIQKEILETFSWEDGSDAEIRGNIGTMLNDMGKTGEADQWFQDWYALSPDDPDCTNFYVYCLRDRGENERAGEVLEAHLPSRPEPDAKYINLYHCAADFYKETGDEQKAAFYQGLVDKINGSDGDFSSVKWEDGDLFGKSSPAQPVKKDKKIYPNDPCPCGFGKKYKKCCGRK